MTPAWQTAVEQQILRPCLIAAGILLVMALFFLTIAECCFWLRNYLTRPDTPDAGKGSES